MKVNKITTQPEFQPVTLQITIESQDELLAIKTLLANERQVSRFLLDAGYLVTAGQQGLLIRMMSCMSDAL